MSKEQFLKVNEIPIKNGMYHLHLFLLLPLRKDFIIVRISMDFFYIFFPRNLVKFYVTQWKFENHFFVSGFDDGNGFLRYMYKHMFSIE